MMVSVAFAFLCLTGVALASPSGKRELVLRLLENLVDKKAVYTCDEGSRQFDDGQKCDGYAHCKDKGDEVGCGACPLQGEVQCTSGRDFCIHPSNACNDFADEGCDEHTAAFCDDPCADPPNDMFKCPINSRGAFICAINEWKCDGEPDCEGEVDETNCKREAIRDLTDKEKWEKERLKTRMIADMLSSKRQA